MRAASGVKNETKISLGVLCLTPSDATVRRIFSPVTGQVDSTRAVDCKISGINKLSQAHQVYNVLPLTSNKWEDIFGSASPQYPRCDLHHRNRPRATASGWSELLRAKGSLSTQFFQQAQGGRRLGGYIGLQKPFVQPY